MNRIRKSLPGFYAWEKAPGSCAWGFVFLQMPGIPEDMLFNLANNFGDIRSQAFRHSLKVMSAVEGRGRLEIACCVVLAVLLTRHPSKPERPDSLYIEVIAE